MSGRYELHQMARLGTQVARLKSEIKRLKKALESTGEAGGVCVGNEIGRRCSYCRCDGRNLTPHPTNGGERE